MDKFELLESYKNAPSIIKETLSKFPKEIYSFKPAVDKWSINEVILHIVDSEINGYVRLRKILAESGSTITAYNQDAWTSFLKYNDQNIEPYLEIFRLIRGLNYQILKDLPAHKWNQYIVHPENGQINLLEWLSSYEKHIAFHVAQMKRNYLFWQEKI